MRISVFIAHTWSSMLCSDLTVILMMMVIALVLNHGSAAKVTLQNGRPAFPSLAPSKVYFRGRNDHLRLTTARAVRRAKQIKNAHRRNWYLNPVDIRLKNVIDKYKLRGEQLKALYPGVVACGSSDCKKFRDLIPENQKIKDLKCLKQKKGFNKAIRGFLSDFHDGVVIIEKSFQILIEFEGTFNLNDDKRREILRELKTDIKSLNLELESVMTNERLKFEPVPEILSPAFRSRPRFRTDLMINEWRVIQDAKRFLEEWKLNLRKIFKCWRKRKKAQVQESVKEEEVRERERLRQQGPYVEANKFDRSFVRFP